MQAKHFKSSRYILDLVLPNWAGSNHPLWIVYSLHLSHPIKFGVEFEDLYQASNVVYLTLPRLIWGNGRTEGCKMTLPLKIFNYEVKKLKLVPNLGNYYKTFIKR